MNHEMLRDYCMKKNGVTEEFPFDNDTLVFKVMGKIFLLTSLEHRPLTMNLKCEPQLAIELREKYENVSPAYHMNKKHWNSVEDRGTLSDWELFQMIDHSYNLVVAGLSKKLQSQVKQS